MTTTTNDDALVDCVIYANDARGDDLRGDVRAARATADPPPRDAQCSITMCGNEDDPECRMLRYCENGHCMHDKCIEYMFREAESLSVAMCPQCRSRHVLDVVLREVPVPQSAVEKMASPDFVAYRAANFAAPEFAGGDSALPLVIERAWADPRYKL